MGEASEMPRVVRVALGQARPPLLRALCFLNSKAGQGRELTVGQEGSVLLLAHPNPQEPATFYTWVPPNALLPSGDRLDEDTRAELRRRGYEPLGESAGYYRRLWDMAQTSPATLADHCLAVLRQIYQVDDAEEIKLRLRRPLSLLNFLFILGGWILITAVVLWQRVPAFDAVFGAFGGAEQPLIAGGAVFVAVGIALLAVVALLRGLVYVINALIAGHAD
jgi:hypothetical protein